VMFGMGLGDWKMESGFWVLGFGLNGFLGFLHVYDR
jgi:hypothetical protein